MSYVPEDVKPYTPVSSMEDARKFAAESRDQMLPLDAIAPVVGMSPTFIRKVIGHSEPLTPTDVLVLLDQDAFAETFVPRSLVVQYLFGDRPSPSRSAMSGLVAGDALELTRSLDVDSVQTVVTSTPYWAMRVYEDMATTRWADGETCPYGLEQTPEGFIRHSVELLYELGLILNEAGSIWWNLGDTYSTRTQIRTNAAEALRAMQGRDTKGWRDHALRRYSAGHSYLKDGEQCLIPSRIAERASRAGLYVKSMISWVKTASLPEPQQSRVSRNVETIIHLTLQRTPAFDRAIYHTLPAALGGRTQWETGKLSDSWILPTSSGRGGHGAQFPLALPGRCIALTSQPGDLVLDPFMGSGTTAIAAERLDRKWVGFDISPKYLEAARRRIETEVSTPRLF